MEPYPSICLGAVKYSLYEMLWGYTMFPSGGFSTKPYYISRIEDKNGNVLDSVLIPKEKKSSVRIRLIPCAA